MLQAKSKTKIGKYFHYFPIAIMIVTVILVIIFRKSITTENIMNLAPDNLFLASLLIITLFAFKAISVMFPGTVLYVITGMIFPNWLAFIVAIIGTIVEIVITYYMGVLCGEIKLITKLKQKSKFKKLFEEGEKNENILVYLSRIIGLPYDVMGMFWGAVGAKVIPYTFFSVLGKLPKVVIETFIGTSVEGAITWQKVVIFIILILITLLITIVSNKLLNNKKHTV